MRAARVEGPAVALALLLPLLLLLLVLRRHSERSEEPPHFAVAVVLTFVLYPTESNKSLRRRLPITPSRITWNNTAPPVSINTSWKLLVRPARKL